MKMKKKTISRLSVTWTLKTTTNMSTGNHKSSRSAFCSQSNGTDMKQLSNPKPPLDPNHGRAPKGLRDFIGRVVDFPWELEQEIEDQLPSPIENALGDLGLAGKPILVAALFAGIVVFATKMSG
jgi:hypothetical protein